MALLTRQAARALLLSSGAMVALGCSFVLDTGSLQKGGTGGGGGAGGSGGSSATSMGGSGGAPAADAAADALTCKAPDGDACATCIAMHCCAETHACTMNDPACNLAFVQFQYCERNAKTRAVQAACGQAFTTNGGQHAAALVGCSVTNCSMACGG